MSKQGIKCQCIRCREIRETPKLPIKLKRMDYEASGGKEMFLQYIDKNNRLYALLRLRINPRQSVSGPHKSVLGQHKSASSQRWNTYMVKKI